MFFRQVFDCRKICVKERTLRALFPICAIKDSFCFHRSLEGLGLLKRRKKRKGENEMRKNPNLSLVVRSRCCFLSIGCFYFVGPSLFFSCPMDYKAAEGWFVNVWNYNVIPYLHQALRSGRKVLTKMLLCPPSGID